MYKDWESVTIRNNFMFQKVMSDEDICRSVIECILGLKIKQLTYYENEKTITNNLKDKGIRLDVYVKDDTGKVFNVEMQTSNYPGDLAQRTRFYQAGIDLSLLQKGVEYNELPEVFVIFICTFDPFGLKLPKYTFYNRCEECSSLTLNDGTSKIFLNAAEYAAASDQIDDNLRCLLEYIESGKCNDNGLVQRIHRAVQKARLNDDWRRDYMTIQTELIMAGRIAKEEDKIEIALNMLRDGLSPNVVKKYTNLSMDKINELIKANNLAKA